MVSSLAFPVDASTSAPASSSGGADAVAVVADAEAVDQFMSCTAEPAEVATAYLALAPHDWVQALFLYQSELDLGSSPDLFRPVAGSAGGPGCHLAIETGCSPAEAERLLERANGSLESAKAIFRQDRLDDFRTEWSREIQQNLESAQVAREEAVKESEASTWVHNWNRDVASPRMNQDLPPPLAPCGPLPPYLERTSSSPIPKLITKTSLQGDLVGWRSNHTAMVFRVAAPPSRYSRLLGPDGLDLERDFKMLAVAIQDEHGVEDCQLNQTELRQGQWLWFTFTDQKCSLWNDYLRKFVDGAVAPMTEMARLPLYEVAVPEGTKWASKTLTEVAPLHEEHVHIMGISKAGRAPAWHPEGGARLEPGSTLLVVAGQVRMLTDVLRGVESRKRKREAA